MKTLRRFPVVAVVVLGLLGLVPAVASAGPLTCPVTITQNTTLHADLDCSGTTFGDAVTFGKPGLTLDLNGFKIIGYNGNDTAVGVYSEFNNDTIENGTIEYFRYNIYTYGASRTLTNHVHVIGDGASSSEGIYYAYGTSNIVKRSIVEDVGYGIDFEYGAENRAIHSKVKSSTYGLYAYYETDDIFARNVFDGTGGGTYGVEDDYSKNSTYLGNVATNASSYGFYFDCDTYGTVTAVGNTALGNGSDGFYVYYCYNDYGPLGSSLIKSNTAKNNGGDGFDDYFSLNARYIGNTAGNNADYGFQLDYPLSDIVDGNVANGNHDDTGIYLEDNYSLYNVQQLAHNTANNNSDYGIYADYGVPPARSADNAAGGNPTENCFNVICS